MKARVNREAPDVQNETKEININIVGTIIEKETTAQLLERDVGNEIKKIIFPRMQISRPATRELIPRSKALKN